MLHYFLKIILFTLVISSPLCCADLPDQLLQLQGKLGTLKGKLGSLKSSLTKLKDKLEGSQNSGQRLLPDKYYDADAKKTFDDMQTDLYTNAEMVGYGYKTANLIQLKELCTIINAHQAVQDLGYEFAVPEFFGITSQQIQDFLKTPDIDLDVAQEWQEIITQYFPSNNEFKQALKDKKYPSGFFDAAKKLETKIKEKFKTIQVGQKSIDEIITTLTQTDRQELSTLIAKVSAQGEKFMVRSTGKEDTDKLANAGGNESIANVSPTAQALINALGIGEDDRLAVVPSYFGSKSLTQRLGAGDESIIEAPFTPVVIQRMIGEKEGKPLPRCGVMFTEEAEGALSKQRLRDENYKIKTSGITIIQAAFGHNEGVVNSIVTVDTYYGDDSGIIHSLIKQKRFRIKPIGEGKLGRIDNAPALVELSTLEPNAVKALKLLANALEDYYKKPMDVEYVILTEGKKKTIYIVQARPIVHDTKQQQPSYLDLNNPTIQSLTKLDGQAIGAAGGALRFINGTAGSVVKKGIGEALSSYQSRDNKNDVQAILIGEMAPATSHEATAFRSESKPVVAVERDFDTLAGWAESEGAKLILDTQQQFIAQWPDSFDPEQEKIITDFIDQNLAKKGWISYPLPQRISLLGNITSQQQNALFQELDAKLFGSTSLQDTLKKFKLPVKNLVKQLKAWIYVVKTGSPQEAQEALANLWVVFNFIPPQPDYIERINQLQTYAARIISYLLENITISPENENYLGKRLFPIHFLETILFQHHKDSEGLYGDSVIKLWTQIKEEKKGAETVTTTDAYGKLAGILTSHGLTQDLKDSWKTFIDSLDSTGKPMQDIMKISKLQRQVAWLTKSIQVLKAGNKNDELRQKLQQDLDDVKAELGAQTISDDDKNKAKFYQMLITLGKLDMLDLWLHTSFPDAWKKDSIDSTDKDFITFLIKQTDALIKEYNQKKRTLSLNQSNLPLEDLWIELSENWSFLSKYPECSNHKNFPQNPGKTLPNFQRQYTHMEEWKTFIKNWDDNQLNHKNPLTLLMKEFDNSEEFLKELLRYKQLIEDVNEAGFEDPTTFLKNWNAFQADPENILSYFIDDSRFIQKFKAAQGLGKLAALGVMEELVTKFDAAIKAVTGSTKFIVTELADGKSFDAIHTNEAALKKQISTQKDKIFAFHLMLEKYLELLQKWYQLSQGSSIKWEYKNVSIEYAIQSQLTKASLKLKEIQNKTNDPGELQAQIHAEGSAIGSTKGGDASDRLAAQTHEELFTFTHQSLLVVITKFMKQYGFKDEQLPQTVKKLDELIAGKQSQWGDRQGGLSYKSYKPSLVGTLFKNNILTRKYNFPQGLHSAAVKLIYNTKTKQCSLTLSMFGADHFARWERCTDYVEYEGLKQSIEEKPRTTFMTKGFDATWSLDRNNPESTMIKLKTVIQNLCTIAGANNQNSADDYFDKNQADKVIELCATRYPRIHCYFNLALNNISDDTINHLITIGNKLLEPGGEYALNSEIYLYRLPLAPDLSSARGNKEIFYGINPNNFYERAGIIGDPYDRNSTNINAYKHINIRNIITKLLELKDKLNPDQQKAFLKLIQDHQEYIVEKWNTINIPETQTYNRQTYKYDTTPEINLKTFLDALPASLLDRKTEILKQLVTQSYYGNNKAVYNTYYSNAPYGTPKIQSLSGAELCQFFIQRGINILRTSACTVLYQQISNNLTQVEKENFVRLVGDALAHKDYLIRENANTLFVTLQQDNDLEKVLKPYLEKINTVKIKKLDTLIAKIATDPTSDSFKQALQLINLGSSDLFNAIEIEKKSSLIRIHFVEFKRNIPDPQLQNKLDDVVKARFRKKLDGGSVYVNASYGFFSSKTTNIQILYIINAIYKHFPDDQNLISLADQQLLDCIAHETLDTIIKKDQKEQDLFIRLAVIALKRKQSSELEDLENNAIRSYASQLSSIEKLFAALIFLDAGVRSRAFLERVINEASRTLSNYYSNATDKNLAKKVLEKIIPIWDRLSFMQTPPGHTKKQLEDLIKPPAYGSSGYSTGSHGSSWSSGSSGYNW